MLQLALFMMLFTSSLQADWVMDAIQRDLSSVSSEDLSPERLLAQVESDKTSIVQVRIQDGVVQMARRPLLPVRDIRAKVMYEFLQETAKKYPLPDCYFILLLTDGPSEQSTVQSPLFCFSKKRKVEKAILLPDCDTISFYDNLIKEADQGSKKYPWRNKVEQAFWRGTTSGQMFTKENYRNAPRVQLVELSLKAPKWVNARFTALSHGAQDLRPLFQKYLGNFVAITEHLKYKYQILVDGNTSAWSRACWQLFSNGVILKQDSEFLQWYYDALIPYKHYIPVANNFSNLIETLEWAKHNDDVCEEISSNGQAFARESLTQDAMMSYTYHLLLAYSKIQSEYSLPPLTPDYLPPLPQEKAKPGRQ